MKASELAPYVIAYNDYYGDLITNKKLQKLLYYIAAWGDVYFKDGIIEDDFVAWVHGPVCVVVYNQYKEFGYSPLNIDYNGSSSSEFLQEFKSQHHNEDDFTEKMALVDEVLNKYIPYTSLQLELLTHSEEPWKEARKGLQPVDKGTKTIDKEKMKTYYSSLINV